MIATAAFLAVLAGCTDEAIVGTNDGDGFFLNRTVLDLNKGTSETLVATVTPKDAAGVSWTSDNTAVATVDGNGQVTAVGAGDALIQAKAGQPGPDEGRYGQGRDRRPEGYGRSGRHQRPHGHGLDLFQRGGPYG